jgi:hypothetical protein
MSKNDETSEPGKLIKMHVEADDRGEPVVTDSSVEDVTIHRSNGGVRVNDSRGTTVGWFPSPTFDKNWEDTFGEKKAEDLN